MYPKFIEVHVGHENKFLPEGVEIDDRVLVNVETIQWFNGDGIVFSCNPEMLECRESYDELKDLITDVGCLIHKADPRLDTEHPLTMHDLQGMLGEPVWNSNTGKWTLVRNYIEAPKPDGVDVAFLLDARDNSTGVTAGDLQAKPLYRMKETRA